MSHLSLHHKLSDILEADDLTKISRTLADAGEETETRRSFLGKGFGAVVAGSLNPVATASSVASPAALATSHSIKQILLANPELWQKILGGVDPFSGEILSGWETDDEALATGKTLIKILKSNAFVSDNDDENEEESIIGYRHQLLSSLTDADLSMIAQSDSEGMGKQQSANDLIGLLSDAYHTGDTTISKNMDFDSGIRALVRLARGYKTSGDELMKILLDNIRWLGSPYHSKNPGMLMGDIENTINYIEYVKNTLSNCGLSPSPQAIKTIDNYIRQIKDNTISKIERAERKEASDRDKKEVAAKDQKQDQYDLMRWEGEGGALGPTNESKFARRLSRILLAKALT